MSEQNREMGKPQKWGPIETKECLKKGGQCNSAMICKAK